jgi:hypothetical protein
LEADQVTDSVVIKAELLSKGVVPTESFLRAYGAPYLTKRRAYGNPDDPGYLDRPLPQELYLLPDNLVCAVNVRRGSEWRLDWSEETGFVVARGELLVSISFPLLPAFYTERLKSGGLVQSVITLYGGGSLGIFVRGQCALVEMGSACQYCSISPNRSRQEEFPTVVTEPRLREALSIALQDKACPISQVMINGGNFRDPNRSFLYYTRLCRAARDVIEQSGREVELHLIVYPPEDLNLLKELKGADVSVAMNMEVFNPVLFREFCPGKNQVLGQVHILAALRTAAYALGKGHVFSILVGGLEDQDTMQEGMELLAHDGVTPIINVFHPDPETPLHSRPSPSVERILSMGAGLQEIYDRSSFSRPFYSNCGRNSLDTEAFRGLF